jgi:hypothetical protein
MTAIDDRRMTAQPVAPTLVGDVLHDAGRLVRQQAAMFRTEIGDDVSRATRSAALLGLGGGLAAAGGLFLAVAVVYGIVAIVPGMPVGAAWALVGVVVLLAGLVAIRAGRSGMGSVTLLPDKSLAALEENLSWIVHHRR